MVRGVIGVSPPKPTTGPASCISSGMPSTTETDMSVGDQKAFSRYFRQKGILYQPGFGIVFKSVNAGIMLSQLLYWHGKGKKKPWTYKTIADLHFETGLTLTQQKTAIGILVKHGILEQRLKGIPATRHFKLDLARLHEALPSLKETSKLTYPNPPNFYVANGDTTTKITRETTTKTGPVKVDRNNFSTERSKLINNKSVRPP